MLTPDDTSLEPSWPKRTPRIEFWSIFNRFWGTLNVVKINAKINKFSDIHRNLVFCAWSSQTLPIEGPKQFPHEAFSANGQNPKIVLSPTRGLSLRGLKQSKISFFSETFARALDMVPWYRCFRDLSRFLNEIGAQRACKKERKNGVQNWCFRVERSSSSREHECSSPPKPRMEI